MHLKCFFGRFTDPNYVNPDAERWRIKTCIFPSNQKFHRRYSTSTMSALQKNTHEILDSDEKLYGSAMIKYIWSSVLESSWNSIVRSCSLPCKINRYVSVKVQKQLHLRRCNVASQLHTVTFSESFEDWTDFASYDEGRQAKIWLLANIERSERS